MKFQEFQTEIKNAYSEQFPNSACNCRVFKCLSKSIAIDCYLAKDKTEVANGIAQNDMFSVSFWATLPDDFSQETDELPELKFECQSISYTVKPPNDYLAYGCKSLRRQNTNGAPEKCIKTFEKLISKLRESVLDSYNDGEIHPNFERLAAQKLFD